MPVIDNTTAEHTPLDPHGPATDAAATVMGIEEVPGIPMFRTDTAAFVHHLPAAAIADDDDGSGFIRVQVLTDAGALDRAKQRAVVRALTDLVVRAAGVESARDRTRVQLVEASDGGCGLWEHVHSTTEMVAAARERIAAVSDQG